MVLNQDPNAKKQSRANQKSCSIANFYQPTRFALCCFDRDAQMLIKAVARCGRHYGVKLREGVANINVCKRKRQN